mmetsp:Transcript_26897/g.72141  ORF Transcript_26897/g.72141 Transcript_26897/m.72141 type:complete len:161 (-) Transcript_26897:77-559(-)
MPARWVVGPDKVNVVETDQRAARAQIVPMRVLCQRAARAAREQAAARAAAPATAEITQMEMTANDEQPASVEPRVAAAATPHKRQAVAAGTAVGVPVGVGGKLAAGDNGTWTTVISRRARRLERERLHSTTSDAMRKAAVARAAATWRTAAAIIEYFGQE